MTLVIKINSLNEKSQLDALGDRLHINVVDNIVGDNTNFIQLVDGKLSFSWPDKLNATKHKKYLNINFNFIEYYNYHKRQNYSFKKEPFYKALGLNKSTNLNILDATCGTGKDAILMLFFGAKLTCFEKSPVIFELLKDALNRACENLEIGHIFKEKMSLNSGDCMLSDGSDESYDTVYIDPMFTKNTKTSLPRKEMQLFREILIEEDNFEALLLWAKSIAHKRVVYKRPVGQKTESSVKISFSGKTTAYDVWFI